jgi:Zn-dependent M16 (insulinase) family peptidase
VHHIDPQGSDSGVVYSEMQGRENTSGDLMSLQYVADPRQLYSDLIFNTLRAQRLLNPPESAYRSETGGLMNALRKLTVEQSDGFPCSSQSPC